MAYHDSAATLLTYGKISDGTPKKVELNKTVSLNTTNGMQSY